MMDKTRIVSTVKERLPLRARWVVRDTTIDWDFSRGRSEPREPDAGDFNFGPVPPEWLVLTVIGEQDVCEGGGATSLIGVHTAEGHVLGLDPEREADPLFFLSSSLPQFVDTFLLFDSVFRTRKLAANRLAERAQALDPGGFNRGEWKHFADFVYET